jgi:hypothetical protein
MKNFETLLNRDKLRFISDQDIKNSYALINWSFYTIDSSKGIVQFINHINKINLQLEVDNDFLELELTPDKWDFNIHNNINSVNGFSANWLNINFNKKECSVFFGDD